VKETENERKGRKRYGAEIDMFAAGCVIYAFLTGRHPFQVLDFVQKMEIGDRKNHAELEYMQDRGLIEADLQGRTKCIRTGMRTVESDEVRTLLQDFVAGEEDSLLSPSVDDRHSATDTQDEFPRICKMIMDGRREKHQAQGLLAKKPRTSSTPQED